MISDHRATKHRVRPRPAHANVCGRGASAPCPPAVHSEPTGKTAPRPLGMHPSENIRPDIMLKMSCRFGAIAGKCCGLEPHPGEGAGGRAGQIGHVLDLLDNLLDRR